MKGGNTKYAPSGSEKKVNLRRRESERKAISKDANVKWMERLALNGRGGFWN